MTTTSRYPRALDTDGNLVRSVSSDTLVPGVLNPKTDAIEAIEQAMGLADDGTAYGAVAFNRGVADHVGFMSTAGPSGRYPWVPADAKAVYGTANNGMGSWTVGSGITVSNSPPKGPVTLTSAADNTMRVCSVAVSNGTPYHMVARARFYGGFGNGSKFQLGFSLDGTDGTLDGFQLDSSGGHAVKQGGVSGDNDLSMGTGYGSPWFGLWITLDGTNLTIRRSLDMLTWDIYYEGANTDVPTSGYLGLVLDVAPGQEVGAAYVDYIAFGSTVPQGQS